MDNNFEQISIWTKWVKFIAWLQLTCCFVISFIVFINNYMIEVPVDGFVFLTKEVINWEGIGAAVGIVIGSILLLALLNLFCTVAEHLFKININTAKIYEELSKLKENAIKEVPTEDMDVDSEP